MIQVKTSAPSYLIRTFGQAYRICLAKDKDIAEDMFDWLNQDGIVCVVSPNKSLKLNQTPTANLLSKRSLIYLHDIRHLTVFKLKFMDQILMIDIGTTFKITGSREKINWTKI